MDITLQMSYVEGRWLQNCDRSKPTDYFTRVKQKLVKICIIFIKRSSPENFQRENFSKGVPTENWTSTAHQILQHLMRLRFIQIQIGIYGRVSSHSGQFVDEASRGPLDTIFLSGFG